MSRIDTVQWGAEHLRVGPWRGDPSIAYVTPAAGRSPSNQAFSVCLATLFDQGYQGVITSALNPVEQQIFRAHGFVVHEHLHLLRHPLEVPVPARPRGRSTRRGRRSDRLGALAVDHLAFEPFWRFDRAGLDDARRATPASRFRVIDHGQVDAYAVTGRAGSVSYLQRLAVRPGVQRQGMGTALVLDALHWSQRHGARSTLVNTQEHNHRALALYERLGFVRQPEGLDVLELDLGTSGPPRVTASSPGGGGLRSRIVGRLAAAAGAVALMVAGAGVPAGSQTITAASPPAVTLIDQSPWVAPVGTFDLQVGVGVVPADAEIVARIYVPISTQAQLDRVARGQSLGQRVESVTVPVAAVNRGADGSLMLSYPMVASGTRSPTGFYLANPGVYPFSVAVVDAHGDTLGQLFTQLIRLPAAVTGEGPTDSTTAPLSVALVVPIGAPVAHRPDRAAALTPGMLSALDAEAAVLSQYPSVAVSVTPVPETVDTLADHDRTTGTHLVADLRAAVGPRSMLSGPYVPVDSGAWVAHGLSSGYDEQLKAGDQALGQLGAGVTDRAAVVDPAATADSLTRLLTHGAQVVVVPSDRLAPSGTRAAGVVGPLTQWFDLGASDGSHVAAIPADAGLAATLSTGSDPVLAAHQVLSALALVSLDHSGSQACVRRPGQPCRRGVAVELPSSPTPTTPALTALMAALSAPTAGGVATPLVQASSVTDFTDVVDPSSASDRTTTDGADTLRHLDTRPVAGLGDYPARFRAATADITSFRTLSADDAGKPLDLATSWQQVALASGSSQLPLDQANSWLAAIDADVTSQLGQITALDQQTVTLTSASGKIPFSISNALDYPVRVLLDFQSPKLHFVNGNQQTVTIPAGQPAHLTIPVTVRASGAFPMQVSVTSPDHRLPIAHTRFDVRSTAISGIGLVLTVAAGVFLALWWARNARNTRRRRSLVASSHPVLRT